MFQAGTGFTGLRSVRGTKCLTQRVLVRAFRCHLTRRVISKTLPLMSCAMVIPDSARTDRCFCHWVWFHTKGLEHPGPVPAPGPSPCPRLLPLPGQAWVLAECRPAWKSTLLLSKLLDEDGHSRRLCSHFLDEGIVVLPLRLQAHLKRHLV